MNISNQFNSGVYQRRNRDEKNFKTIFYRQFSKVYKYIYIFILIYF